MGCLECERALETREGQTQPLTLEVPTRFTGDFQPQLRGGFPRRLLLDVNNVQNTSDFIILLDRLFFFFLNMSVAFL